MHHRLGVVGPEREVLVELALTSRMRRCEQLTEGVAARRAFIVIRRQRQIVEDDHSRPLAERLFHEAMHRRVPHLVQHRVIRPDSVEAGEQAVVEAAEVAALEPEERERAGVMEDVDREMVGQVFK